MLKVEAVSRRFGAVIALKSASLEVSRGEVVALMGANGAGKSTLVKILAGVQKPNGGTITVDGQPYRVHSPAHARLTGIVTVYQEPSLIPDLSLRDNLRLGKTPIESFRHWMNALGIDRLDFMEMAGRLPLATLRILDLARALACAPKLLMLDEMTAALPTDLVARVLKVVRDEADKGQSVIYISHRFREIAEICNRASILRDGETVCDLEIEPGIEDRVVELMLGGKGAPVVEFRPFEQRDQNQVIPQLRANHLGTGARLSDVSLDIFKGEVLGIVALEGQGQDELFDILGGNRKPASGQIEIDGNAVNFGHPADAIAAGVSLVPGDRTAALLMQRSVHENIALPGLARLREWFSIDGKAEASRLNAAIERLQIDTRSKDEVRRLSGGNQQKVTIARWIAQGVKTLLLYDPTRGIDIKTKRQIYALVRDLATQGAAILFYTSELAEIRQACDRVIVLYNGRVVDEFLGSEADDERLMRAAHGLSYQKAVSA
jgi:ribose transport system ATP-binding protein